MFLRRSIVSIAIFFFTLWVTPGFALQKSLILTEDPDCGEYQVEGRFHLAAQGQPLLTVYPNTDAQHEYRITKMPPAEILKWNHVNVTVKVRVLSGRVEGQPDLIFNGSIDVWPMADRTRFRNAFVKLSDKKCAKHG